VQVVDVLRLPHHSLPILRQSGTGNLFPPGSEMFSFPRRLPNTLFSSTFFWTWHVEFRSPCFHATGVTTNWRYCSRSASRRFKPQAIGPSLGGPCFPLFALKDSKFYRVTRPYLFRTQTRRMSPFPPHHAFLFFFPTRHKILFCAFISFSPVSQLLLRHEGRVFFSFIREVQRPLFPPHFHPLFSTFRVDLLLSWDLLHPIRTPSSFSC